VYTVMNLQVAWNVESFLTIWGNISFPKKLFRCIDLDGELVIWYIYFLPIIALGLFNDALSVTVFTASES
jgi:hypothetical protein